MTRQEINNRIAEIEKERFALDMKDRWDTADYLKDDKLRKEWLKLTHHTKAIDEEYKAETPFSFAYHFIVLNVYLFKKLYKYTLNKYTTF